MFSDIENDGVSQTIAFKDSKNLIVDDDEGRVIPTSLVKKRDKYFMIAGSVTALVIMIYCFTMESHIISSVFHKLHGYLDDMYEKNSFVVLAIILVLIIVNYLLLLPTQTMINIVSTFIINDPIKSWVILTVFSVIAATIVFLFCKYCFKDYLTNKFMGNTLYDILEEESKISPYKTAFLTRIILIPAGVKEYILTLTGNPYHSFIISGFFVHGFYVLEAVLIAQGVSDIHEYMTQKKSWSDKSTFEKFSFFVIASSVLFTIGILAIVGFWATKRVQAKKDIQKMIIEIDTKK